VRVDVESCLKIGMPEQGLRRLERFANFVEPCPMRMPKAVPRDEGQAEGFARGPKLPTKKVSLVEWCQFAGREYEIVEGARVPGSSCFSFSAAMVQNCGDMLDPFNQLALGSAALRFSPCSDPQMAIQESGQDLSFRARVFGRGRRDRGLALKAS
jgi:hypothetical protein